MTRPRLTLRLATLGAASLLVAYNLAAQGSAPPRETIVIVHAQVVDVATGVVRPKQTLVIAGGRIQAMGADGKVALPRGARTVDARGLYATPGLWDMHAHLSATSMRPRGASGPSTIAGNADFVLPLFVANGVTGVRDMSGDLQLLRSWRAAVTAGQRLGPRLVVTGNKIGGTARVVPGAPFPLTTDDDIRSAVRALKRDGADFVKYLELPAVRFPALMAAARAEGLPVAGHVPPWMPLSEISDAGMASTEHLLGMAQATSGEEATLLEEARNEQTWWGQLLIRVGIWSPERRLADRQRRAIASSAEAKTAQLFARLKRNATWQVPTLAAIRHINGMLDDSTMREAREAYRLPFMVGRRKDWASGDTLANYAFVRWAFQTTGDMHRAGVPLLAGSDMPGTNRLAGFSLHDELGYLVQAGLSPLDALRAATIRPAEFLAARDSLGTLEPGKLADILLVRGNPLDDITRMQQLDAVIVDGRYIGRRDLDALLAQARTLATQWRAEAPAPTP
ncbi:MAG: amidohydrolase family protein [Gemmatimonadaceae bacterium]|nr:amidohydrolase family protein [Gemmatimonadaceae bacterium]